MTKATRVIIRGDVTVEFNHSGKMESSTTVSPAEHTDSRPGDVDVSAIMYYGDTIIVGEFSNPWIGSPWAAVGTHDLDSGWSNDRTDLGEGESKVFNVTIFTDDSEIIQKVRVIRLADTDTKNFEVWPNWY